MSKSGAHRVIKGVGRSGDIFGHFHTVDWTLVVAVDGGLLTGLNSQMEIAKSRKISRDAIDVRPRERGEQLSNRYIEVCLTLATAVLI